MIGCDDIETPCRRLAALQELMPFVKGVTLLFWSVATWWIPLLVVLGAWRHLYNRVPLQYTPQYWSLVFPMGMYATCTFQLAKAMRFKFLSSLPPIVFHVALAAWVAAFAGLLHHLGRRFISTAT